MILKNKKGFSLIELMLVIAIISIMTSIILISMNKQKDSKAAETAAREVAAAVREAQNYALTGKNASPGCVVSFTYGGSSYRISGCTSANYTLKNGVTFSGGGSFSFTLPRAELSAPAAIVVSKGDSSYSICIDSSGRVREPC